ncbi:MAG: glycosyltransferase [bacterium]|nr:glycosyltransferase [bacterium]
MKIAMLSDPRNVHSIRALEYYATHGDDVKMFTCERPADFDDNIVHMSGTSVKTMLNCSLTLSTLRRHLDEFEPDVIIAYGVSGYGWLGGRVGNAPLALALTAVDLPEERRGKLFDRWRARRVLSATRLVISDSARVFEHVRSLTDESPRFCQSVSGIDRDLFEQAGTGSGRRKVILHNHPLESRFNVEIVVNGLAGFLQVFPDWRLRLVGDGQRKQTLVGLAQSRGIEGNLDFSGELSASALGEAVADAQIFISAAGDADGGEALLTAMARGAYPVVTDCPFNRDWLEEEPRAMFFNPTSADDMTRALLKAVALPLESRRAAIDANRQKIAASGIREDNLLRIREALMRLVEERA